MVFSALEGRGNPCEALAMTVSTKIDRIAEESADQRQELLQRLKNAAPEAFVEGKLDIDTLKALLGEAEETRAERYTFTWAGKRDAMAMLQAPTRATLIPDTAANVDFDAAQHVFIEGENLEVLKVLYRSYHGRVKLIYMDPPYNTGGDFIYSDNFEDPLAQYLIESGQIDGNGNLFSTNIDRAGRKHSSWLSMMYPRLSLARQLLREDGVVFVSIDDREVHNLRRLMDEVFGEECFAAQIAVVNNLKGRNDRAYIATAHEYVLMYAMPDFESLGLPLTSKQVAEYDEEDEEGENFQWRDLRKRGGADTRKVRPNLYFPVFADPTNGDCSMEKSARHTQPVYPTKSDGTEGCWRWGDKKVRKNIRLLRASKVDSKDRWNVSYRVYLQADGKMRVAKPKSAWIGPEYSTDAATKSLAAIIQGLGKFTPKPVEMMKTIVVQSMDEDDICIDLFSGSCALGQALLELNAEDATSRNLIAIQYPEKINESLPDKSIRTLADVGLERLRRTAERLGKDLGIHTSTSGTAVRSFVLSQSHIRRWAGTDDKTPEGLAKQLEVFQDTLVQGWKPEGVVWEAAIREGYSLTAKLAPFTGAKGGNFWRVTDTEKNQSFTINLDEALTLEAVRALDLKKEDLFICRATALTDTLAANLALQYRLKVL